jgi:putative acyl-CoA dehydrogenase
MSALHPRSQLETHDVFNQAAPFEDVNLFTSDVALQAAVAAAGGEMHAERLSAFGVRAGSAETAAWAMQANENSPRLKVFDRYGQRIDEVEFHPAYHRLMTLGVDAGVSSAAWSGAATGHVLHTALEFLMAQAEPGVCCPMTMTAAAPAALRCQPDIAARWMPKIVASRYDPSSRPMHGKSGVTIGMAMTEKQGGSDVRANTTRAVRHDGGGYVLTGHKWFCSAPMSDAFLTLAHTDKGLTCFLAPRWTPDGERNAIHLMRLKDKLGDRANASAEIEYHGAYAEMVGEEGRGVPTIIEMVHATRFDCILAPAAYMRQAVANALWHAAHRTAFQRKLIDQPLMRSVLADMAIESEAATALTFRIAKSFDESADDGAAAFARLATPIGKYWINKRVVNLAYEAMEVHGGGGYVEDGVMTRIYRQSPLNSIWEGSGNVVCLDILRAIRRDPRSAQELIAELTKSRGANRLLDRAIDDVKSMLAGQHEEALARHRAETMALALQGAILIQNAPGFVSDAFCTTRLCDHPGLSCGASDAKIDVDAVLGRAMPYG